MKRTFLVALGATAVLVSPAAAESAQFKNFKVPGGKIRCSVVAEKDGGIECYSEYIREMGELDSYLGLKARGKAVYSERGDFPGFDSPFRTLQKGVKWKRDGVRCVYRLEALTCTNRDKHGFKIADADVRRF